MQGTCRHLARVASGCPCHDGTPAKSTAQMLSKVSQTFEGGPHCFNHSHVLRHDCTFWRSPRLLDSWIQKWKLLLALQSMIMHFLWATNSSWNLQGACWHRMPSAKDTSHCSLLLFSFSSICCASTWHFTTDVTWQSCWQLRPTFLLNQKINCLVRP